MRFAKSLLLGQLSRAFAPPQLFTNGEQGAWYDPSDMSTLYQDSGGTTPVTALTQPVGLMLDKRLGLVRGVEVSSDTGFDNAGAWSATATAPATSAVAGSQARIVSPAAEVCAIVFAGAPANGACVVGKWYEFTLDVAAYTGSAGVHFSGASNVPIPAGVGVKKIIALADGTFAGIKRLVACDLTLNSMSVREIPGNHASQATAASRPTWQQDANGFYRLLHDGVDDWLGVPHIEAPLNLEMAFGVQVTGGAGAFRSIYTQRDGTAAALAGDIVYADSANLWAQWTGQAASWDMLLGPAAALNALAVPTTRRNGLLKGIQVSTEAELRSNAAVSYNATPKAGRLMAGLDADAAAGFFCPGNFYGGIIVASALSPTLRAAARSYIGQRMGLYL